jgi:hypothetical protein
MQKEAKKAPFYSPNIFRKSCEISSLHLERFRSYDESSGLGVIMPSPGYPIWVESCIVDMKKLLRGLFLNTAFS